MATQREPALDTHLAQEQRERLMVVTALKWPYGNRVCWSETRVTSPERCSSFTSAQWLALLRRLKNER